MHITTALINKHKNSGLSHTTWYTFREWICGSCDLMCSIFSFCLLYLSILTCSATYFGRGFDQCNSMFVIRMNLVYIAVTDKITLVQEACLLFFYLLCYHAVKQRYVFVNQFVFTPRLWFQAQTAVSCLANQSLIRVNMICYL